MEKVKVYTKQRKGILKELAENGCHVTTADHVAVEWKEDTKKFMYLVLGFQEMKTFEMKRFMIFMLALLMALITAACKQKEIQDPQPATN